ncbi:lipid-binding SYLF domain-containing protein [Massilia eurypsychrophila]|nr:lipid-binding SYLF domain-containing protein [Massilia eurypsychrophila]
METRTDDARLLRTACALVLLAASGLAGAQATTERRAGDAPAAATADTRQESSAIRHVADANAEVQKMLQEPRMRELLQQAKGVFLVPRYGRAALGVGASGGTGVLLVKRADGQWSDPVFYNIGGISAGAQVGAEAGAIALVLNNEKAVNRFMQKNQFSLNAGAGLTLVNWSKIAQGSLGDGDVVVWSGTRGLYGSLVSVGVSDIRHSENLTGAYYRQTATVADVLAGKHSNPHSQTLKQTLAGGSSGSSVAPTPTPRY